METPPDNQYENAFDREKEKERRQEIRKQLELAISAPLKTENFIREGKSKWTRKLEDKRALVYLQRSVSSHAYYIEAGICEEKDIPEGKKIDIVYCDESSRHRLEHIAGYLYRLKHAGEEDVEEKATTVVQNIRDALSFDIPDGFEKYPGEYFFPSVSPEEVDKKIEIIQKAIEEYIPAWLKEKTYLNL